MSTYGRVRTYLENGLRRTIPENVWKYVGSFEDAIGALDDALRSGGEANIELLRNDAVSVVKRLEEHFPAGQHAAPAALPRALYRVRSVRRYL